MYVIAREVRDRRGLVYLDGVGVTVFSLGEARKFDKDHAERAVDLLNPVGQSGPWFVHEVSA